mgnify:FL=1|jgi:hypothetical protein
MKKIFDIQKYYNGYRSVFEGQKRIVVKKWVDHFYKVYYNNNHKKRGKNDNTK